jgi:Rrf2 family protein
MLSSPSKYALKALLVLSKRGSEDFHSVSKLAEEAEIPAPYLSKIIESLGRSNLVETKKGVGGGVRIAKKKISFYEVCEVFREPVLIQNCLLSSSECIPGQYCSVHEEWKVERKRIVVFLKSSFIEC